MGQKRQYNYHFTPYHSLLLNKGFQAIYQKSWLLASNNFNLENFFNPDKIVAKNITKKNYALTNDYDNIIIYSEENTMSDNYIYGYARVSTHQQDLSRQLDMLKQYNCTEILNEKMSGMKADRPELNRLKDKVRAGDMQDKLINFYLPFMLNYIFFHIHKLPKNIITI